MLQMGHSLPNWAIRNMSVHYPIADMRADVAGRRFGPASDIGLCRPTKEKARLRAALAFDLCAASSGRSKRVTHSRFLPRKSMPSRYARTIVISARWRVDERRHENRPAALRWQ